MTADIITGDALTVLRGMEAGSVQMCVTSPPYWGLRTYLPDGHKDKAHEHGLEPTPDEYVARMVEVFREVRRVLKDDGTCWVNVGDSYATGAGKVGDCPGGGEQGAKWADSNQDPKRTAPRPRGPMTQPNRMPLPGLKPKDMVGIPWMLAFALRADGWYLRQDIIWAKPNPMPESVRDRCTKSHEYVFLLSKAERYFYDQEAIKEPALYPGDEGYLRGPIEGCDSTTVAWRAKSMQDRKLALAAKPDKQRGHSRRHDGLNDRWDAMERTEQCSGTRNKRDVWTIATQPFSQAHFATFPEALVRPCVLAGSRSGDTVADVFAGSGTTGVVCRKLGRRFLGIELSSEYADMARRRIAAAQPGLGL